MGSLGEVIRFRWGHEGEDLMVGFVSLWEETPDIFLSLSGEGTVRRWPSEIQQESFHWQPNHQYFDLGLRSSVKFPELWEIDPCCLSHPVYGTLLWQTKLTKTIGIKLLKDMVSLIFEESISLGGRLMTGNIWMITVLFSMVLTFYSLNILLEAGQRRKNILAL